MSEVEVESMSPVAAKMLNDSAGNVGGKAALREYFKLLDVTCGLLDIVLYHVDQKGTRASEFMEFNADRRVVRMVANYHG